MRPIRLSFIGFNSFSERAEIDFRRLGEFGIFGIFGDTGSGKSTILDCIGFALYGRVLRVSGRDTSIADVINYRCDRAEVRFEFEIVYEGARRTFCAERELRRKNASQNAKVYEEKEGVWAVCADGVRDCDALLERIVGLEQRDFEKCIALPQGEFAQFVKAARGDRLRLIARLFDLEAYGDRLVRTVNSALSEQMTKRRVVEARLEPYAEVSEAHLKELLGRVKALSEKEHTQIQALSRAEEEEKRLSALAEKRREAEAAQKRLASLDAVKEEVGALERELGRLEHAAAVLAAQREGTELRARSDSAMRELSAAEEELSAAQAAFALWANWDEEALDGELARLAAERERASSAEETRKKRKKAAELLEKTEREKSALRLDEFDYDAMKAEKEGALEALGTGNFEAFSEERAKAGLLRGEYAVFSGELSDLTRKHPAIEADSAPLIQKYTRLSEGEEFDFSALRREFKEREQTRDRLRAELLELERRRDRAERARSDFERLEGERVRLQAEIEECDRSLGSVPTLAEAESAYAAKRAEKREKSLAKAAAADRLKRADVAAATAKERAEGAKTALSGGIARYRAALAAGEFSDAEEARALTGRYGDASEARARVTRFREEYAAVSSRVRELGEAELGEATEERLAAAKCEKEQLSSSLSECRKELAVTEETLRREERQLSEKQALSKELVGLVHTSDLLSQLKKLLEGNKFMEFVAEEYLQTVAVNASGRLLSLTDGRYFLRYEGGFFVGDNFNGGELRSVSTLSGGETFLVSLSLALALGAEICARSLRPIEFFFLDEGFGTLDGRLVDTVMDSLEKLRSERFTIGIISHVEELKHRIDRKLSVVKATEQRGSQIIAE